MSYYSTDTSVQEMTIERFAGVDFSTDPTKVDPTRSPDACNMIADATYFPVKRTGYRGLMSFGVPIYGLHRLDEHILVHAGTKMYRMLDSSAVALYEGMAEGPSRSFRMNGKLWILDGKTYLVYDGVQVVPVRSCAFVPTTTIGAPPAGGGESLEAVNMLTPYRINTFVGDGTTKTFQLDCRQIDADSVTCSGYTIASVNVNRGTVTFANAPEDGDGLANVVIQFAKTVPEYSGKIDRCRIFGLYGGSNDTRVFVSGDPQEPNCDWQSGLYDPSYFPDTGYTRVGADASAIMGYLRQYDTQLVLKEDGQDAKQYLRTFALDDNDRPAYSLKQGAEAAGAVSMAACAELEGIPMYLSASGVMGVFGTYVTDQRMISGVSHRIDKRLTKEPDLQNAVLCVWRDHLYLSVNGHCYVADGRQMANSIPEWYYWENIPATCFFSEEDGLWFGTADGRVCKFCAEDETGAYLDDGEPICARWSTPFTALGSWNCSKNILSFYPVLMPYRRSSAELYYQTERGREQAEDILLTLFSFAEVDFSRFSFRTVAAAVPIPVNRRKRRVFLFQGIVQNRQPEEPFGMLGLVIRYTVGTPMKGKRRKQA
ncbi:MAG: hypothetical protein Q4F79_07340 [Eubacteriales bacterium]|nr:hypothetical protein [Eubacteriales bacterium]